MFVLQRIGCAQSLSLRLHEVARANIGEHPHHLIVSVVLLSLFLATFCLGLSMHDVRKRILRHAPFLHLLTALFVDVGLGLFGRDVWRLQKCQALIGRRCATRQRRAGCRVVCWGSAGRHVVGRRGAGSEVGEGRRALRWRNGLQPCRHFRRIPRCGIARVGRRGGGGRRLCNGGCRRNSHPRHERAYIRRGPPRWRLRPHVTQQLMSARLALVLFLPHRPVWRALRKGHDAARGKVVSVIQIDRDRHQTTLGRGDGRLTRLRCGRIDLRRWGGGIDLALRLGRVDLRRRLGRIDLLRRGGRVDFCLSGVQ